MQRYLLSRAGEWRQLDKVMVLHLGTHSHKQTEAACDGQTHGSGSHGVQKQQEAQGVRCWKRSGRPSLGPVLLQALNYLFPLCPASGRLRK